MTRHLRGNFPLCKFCLEIITLWNTLLLIRAASTNSASNESPPVGRRRQCQPHSLKKTAVAVRRHLMRCLLIIVCCSRRSQHIRITIDVTSAVWLHYFVILKQTGNKGFQFVSSHARGYEWIRNSTSNRASWARTDANEGIRRSYQSIIVFI